MDSQSIEQALHACIMYTYMHTVRSVDNVLIITVTKIIPY